MDRRDPSTKNTVRPSLNNLYPEDLIDLQSLSGRGLREDFSTLGRALSALWHRQGPQPAEKR